MKKIINNIEAIPGIEILKNLFANNIPSIEETIIKDIIITNNMNEVHIKIVFNQKVSKLPKQWVKYKYDKIGILIKCVNIKKLQIKFSNSGEIDKLKYKFYKYENSINKVEIRDFRYKNNLINIEAESIYFDEPFGINSELFLVNYYYNK